MVQTLTIQIDTSKSHHHKHDAALEQITDHVLDELKNETTTTGWGERIVRVYENLHEEENVYPYRWNFAETDEDF